MSRFRANRTKSSSFSLLFSISRVALEVSPSLSSKRRRDEDASREKRRRIAAKRFLARLERGPREKLGSPVLPARGSLRGSEPTTIATLLTSIESRWKGCKRAKTPNTAVERKRENRESLGPTFPSDARHLGPV